MSVGRFKLNMEYLRSVCESEGISFNSLSQKVGYSRAWLNSVARRDCKVSLQDIAKLASILKCDINSLYVRNINADENYKYYNILVNNLNVIEDDKLLELANICVDELKRRNTL